MGNKRYIKPQVLDLNMQVARAACAMGQSDASEGTCGEGGWAGQPWGDCAFGSSPRLTGSCNAGPDPDSSNYCVSGFQVL